MIQGVGTDIIEVQRIERSIQRYGQRFLDRLFTPNEQAYCLRHRDSGRHLAGRFAAKEAIAKALGTGLSETIGWLDMEIINDRNGKPEVTLSPRLLEALGPLHLNISISHSRDYAVAFAICETTTDKGLSRK
ncbi:MAG: holo-ACP synthase [Parachlamydiaceae bacterium]